MKPAAPFLQLTASGIRWKADASRLKTLQQQFEKKHFLKIPGFISGKLCSDLVKQIEAAEFYKKNHKNIAVDLCMRENQSLRKLQFLMNDPELFARVQELTNCPPIGCVTGRVYRMVLGTNHDNWHNDLTEHRLVAFSVNLSPKKYKGGSLWMREEKKGGREWEVPNLVPGDALIFRLRQDLMHKVANIEGENPKTAYAGWFKAKPHFLSLIKSPKNKKRGIS